MLRFARLTALLAVTCFPAAGLAQSPSAFPVVPGLATSEWLAEPARAAGGDSDSRPSWHVDLLLGIPLGLRAQRNLGESPWLWEGFVGLAGISPAVGAGIRREFVLLRGDYGALSANPGVDAYLGYFVDLSGIGNAMGGGQGNSGPAAYLVGDVDLVWSRGLGGGGESLVGFKLGAGVGNKGTLPVVSLFFGWGF